jgi:splicing factor 3B subunit 4
VNERGLTCVMLQQGILPPSPPPSLPPYLPLPLPSRNLVSRNLSPLFPPFFPPSLPPSLPPSPVTNNPKSYALYARMGYLPVDTCLSIEGLVYSLIPLVEGALPSLPPSLPPSLVTLVRLKST